MRRRTGSGPGGLPGLDAMAAVGGALTRIDHPPTSSLPFGIPDLVAVLQTGLGLRPEPAVEIADPHGSAYSRSLRSANGAPCIPLNISDGGETRVTRFLDALGGAGYLQQIALATDDIFAAGATRQAGVAPSADPGQSTS